MTTETRYLLRTTQTINGLLGNKLDLDFTGTSGSRAKLKSPGATTVYAGIRVWKRATDGTETEITAGTPVAQVSTIANRAANPPVEATYSCPLTALVSTDSIVVRWYTKFDADAWQEWLTSTTGQLGAESLDAATWTVRYCWQVTGSTIATRYSYLWFDGDWEAPSYYDTELSSFTWTPYVPPSAGLKRLLVGVGL